LCFRYSKLLRPMGPPADTRPVHPLTESTTGETNTATELAYTYREKRVLLSGLIGGREKDGVWSRYPEAIEKLANRGFIRIGQEVLANGTISSFPLCLSPAGVAEARWLEDVDRLTSGQ
jgi:hypothetical protein